MPAIVTSLLVFVLLRSNMETFNHRINTHFESWLGPRGESLILISPSVADSRCQRCLGRKKSTSDQLVHLCPDERVRGLLLLDYYPPTIALTVVYLLIVWMGPKYMKHRQPYSCRGAMMIYNLGLTLLSFYMFYEVNADLSPSCRRHTTQRCACKVALNRIITTFRSDCRQI